MMDKWLQPYFVDVKDMNIDYSREERIFNQKINKMKVEMLDHIDAISITMIKQMMTERRIKMEIQQEKDRRNKKFGL